MDAETRRAIERWFASRGVPQLIEGFSSEQRMDARAGPYIAIWIVVGTYLLWGRRPDASLMDNVVAGTIAVVASLLAIGAFLWVRRHIPFDLTSKLDLLDIAIIGVVPAIAAGVVHGSPGVAIGVIPTVLLGVGVIYLVTGFGLLELAGWALGYLRAQLGQIVTLVSRTLPVLLILVVFLLFASELWQAAHTLGGADLAAVIGLLLLVATILCLNRGRDEIGAIEASRDPDAIAGLLEGTPAEPLAPRVRSVGALPRRLMWQERLNLLFLMLISQLLQSLFVGLLVTVFLVALGLLAIPASVQETWVGEPVRTVVAFELFDEPRHLSAELLITAGLLGGMCALYFTGLALTDAAFRTEFHERVVGDVEQIMAVHVAYLAAVEIPEIPD
jgi:uncharacterized membrane protein